MDINILDHLDKSSIVLTLKQKGKKSIISTLLDHLVQENKINKDKKKEILKVILQREEMGSTAIGGYIALPHARIDSVENVLICFAVSKEGVNFDSLDQEPVHIIALLISNQKEAGLHLKMLAFLARMLRDKHFIQQLKNAGNEEEVLALINKQQQIMR
jgi:fructose-specific phosphotransferase system IIA component